jgi:starch phosphorylase
MAGLYALLENEVVPLYYDLGIDGVPHGWCTIVKNAIRTAAPRFSARRMLKEYVNRAYTPLFSDAMKSQDEKLA